MSFAERSYEKELLDGTGIPFADIRRNMEELDLINRRLGGHRITLAGLQSFLAAQPERNTWHVAEVGCGGGDNLRALGQWAERTGYHLTLTGIDINPECIAYASGRKGQESIRFHCSDYRQFTFERPPDIIFSSLFCHHFNEEELGELLRWKGEQAATGFFINDLHRHPLAYRSIRLLTALFSRSYLVKNDAPLSVRRGFVRADWERLFRAAGLSPHHCEWRWAFRWLVVWRRDLNT